ncbi:MAG: hypothetical protein H0W30_15515 [Gemmatimonadaceae bacterium]|nr:hypothetical protein [Gemmatimonadaceae bacterium]
MRLRSREILAICFGLPVIVLSGAYAWLVAEHGSLLLWNVTVHESGNYTLGETILYFRHFLREVPTLIGMALFTVAAYVSQAGVPQLSDARTRGAAGRIALYTLGSATMLVLLSFLIAAREYGVSSALLDLGQWRTRDDLVVAGSHWRFHWLSSLWFAAAAIVAVRILAWLHASDATGAVTPRGIWWIAGGYFIGLTLIFGLSREIFLDPRYVGHQAREILTHGPVTLPLTIGALYVVVSRLGYARGGMQKSVAPFLSRDWLAIAALVLSLAIPLGLALGTLFGNALATGQRDHGLAAMVAAHFFEHLLDYVLTLLMVIGAYALVAWRRA